MSTLLKQSTLAPVTLFSGGSTSSLSNNNNVVGSAADFSQTNLNVNGYPRMRFCFSGTFAAAPAAPSSLSVYLLYSTDGGTTYETSPGSGATPPKLPAATIALDGVNATQVRTSEAVFVSPLNAKPVVYNNGTGQSINAGWSLTVIPETDQGV